MYREMSHDTPEWHESETQTNTEIKSNHASSVTKSKSMPELLPMELLKKCPMQTMQTMASFVKMTFKPVLLNPANPTMILMK